MQYDTGLEKTLPSNRTAERQRQTSELARSMSALDTRDFTDSAGSSRLRDLLLVDAIMAERDGAVDSRKGRDVLQNVQSALDDMESQGDIAQRSSTSVASNFLSDLLHSSRTLSKNVRKYHNYSVKTLKQPYMHVEGSRYCLSLGVHSHNGPSAKQAATKMTHDAKIMAEQFQEVEEKLLRFAVDLERELVLERRQTQEVKRALNAEKLEFARLLEKFEAMKQYFQKQLTEEKNSFKEYKEAVNHERERERDEWEKERDRTRSRGQEREREMDRMVQRHQVEISALERERDRSKQSMLREQQEVDKLAKELDKLARQHDEDKEMWERQRQQDQKRAQEKERMDMEARDRDRKAFEKERMDWQDRLNVSIAEKERDRESFQEERRVNDIAKRHSDQEKGALHNTIVERNRNLEDTKSKLNTLAADNILLREVMTDLRVNNKRLGSELKEALSVPPHRRPEWKSYFYKEKQ